MTVSNPTQNILQYESTIWSTADLLRGCGIKESEWPSYMMPFFALVMIESRLLRMFDELKAELGEDTLNEIEPDDLIALIQDKGQGYNVYIFEKHQTLKDICQNDKAFDVDFDAYLKGYDEETKVLLGVDAFDGEKFLDIKGVIAKLKAKKVLFSYVKEWSSIDLKPFNNSDITTLEEHIKRRWADISAETAGEQYTPDDVIALIAEIIASKIEDSDRLLKIYDCTCGGGNLLFGVEDRIKAKVDRLTQTFGQDWNDALYALAKIESRFRVDSKIEHGNTLTDDKFFADEFDVVVANPPYGVDWKGFQKDYEIIPYHRDPDENQAAIDAFMAKYITKPFEYLENVVGVEINFNKVFYKPEQLRSVEEILEDISELDQQLKELEDSLSL